MARKRMIDPEFWLDEELASLSPHARLLYIGLWGICDDNYATLPNRPGWIKVQVFPYESVNTQQLLDELSKHQKIILFNENGEEFWFIKNFFKYQRVDRPSAPKYPEYRHESMSTQEGLDEGSTRARPEVKLSKDKLREVKLSKDNIISTRKFSTLESIDENTLIGISEDYRAPIGLVRLSLEELKNYCSSHGKTYRDYKATLKNWVLNAMKKEVNKNSGDPTKKGIDASHL